MSTEFDDESLDSCYYQNDVIDSPTLKHPAFTRQSAARIEHRRFRHISDGYTLSELSKESSIQHKVIVQRRKNQKQGPPAEANNSKDEEPPADKSRDQFSTEENPDDVDEHAGTHKVSNFQTSSPIAAQNAQLRSKFFGASHQDDKFQSGLAKSYSASSVSSNSNIGRWSSTVGSLSRLPPHC